MALFNHATKEVTAKLVYYGPGLCGKTTNLQWIHEHMSFKTKGKLISLATQADRTLFFDFLPVELGTIRGMRTRMQIYTVPGQVFYEATRRMVLKGCDAVVFVADSQAAMLDANGESLRSLHQNLLANEIDPSIPQVIQYNKRDLPTALPIQVLNARLNPRQVPYFEAVAFRGEGVEETLKGITRLLFHWLAHCYGVGEAAESKEPPEAPVAAPPVPPAVVAPAASSGPVRPATVEVPPVTAVHVTTPQAATPRAAAPPAAPPPTVRLVRLPPVVAPPTAPPPAVVEVSRPASAPPAMSVPPAMPAGVRFEPPKPAAAGPKPVLREPEPAAPKAPELPAPRGEGLRADQWLYLLDGAQRGPIDVEDLVDLVLTSIPQATKVWHPGLETWVPADQVREIAEEIPPPLPAPGTPRSGYVEEEMPDFDTVPSMLRTVLIADEDAAFRRYLAMPLVAQGFTVYEAADGSAAWQLAVQNRPWMILADVSMPEVDGFEFCRRIRSHPLLARMPLLFISGSDRYKDRYRALQIGADDFLTKSMPIRELLMRIQLLMTRYSDLADSGEQKPGAAEVAGAFQGRIEMFGAPALLQMCAQGRLTGLFTALAEDGANTATVMGFREGDIVSATAGTATGAEGVYAFLGWEKGSFRFTPGDPGRGEPLAQSVEHLLLEGCRLLDESRQGGDGSAPA
jgi:mutual gliding-motility protein MglA